MSDRLSRRTGTLPRPDRLVVVEQTGSVILWACFRVIRMRSHMTARDDLHGYGCGVSDARVADLEAAVELVRKFCNWGDDVEAAMAALAHADLMVTGMAMMMLASPMMHTLRCRRCGLETEHRCDPADSFRPRLYLVPGQEAGEGTG
jgi:hypothetical protein